MAINNSRDYLAQFTLDGVVVTDHLLTGGNREVPPGTYTPIYDPEQYDSVTFAGTVRNDTLIGGGGEIFTFFMGGKGNDFYGVDFPPDTFSRGFVDYSNARSGVYVDMSHRSSRTFTDESGDVRTVEIFGRAWDGFGGVDQFMEAMSPDFSGFSSVQGVFGTSHRDVMIGDGYEFYGAGGHDLLIGGSLYGGNGNDILKRRTEGDFSGGAYGGDGNDLILGADFIDSDLIGGTGNDRIFAGAGDDGAGRGRFVSVTGNEGNDYVDGGAGDDFIDGGVGSDILVSGAGNDIINPDVEYFQTNPNQPKDDARDVLRLTRADLGDFTDVVLSRAFEAGRDEIRFHEAVKGRTDYRIFYEGQSINPANGRPFQSNDLADVQNTVLQIDWNRDGFGEAAPDAADYFLTVLDATLTETRDFLLT